MSKQEQERARLMRRAAAAERAADDDVSARGAHALSRRERLALALRWLAARGWRERD